MWWNRKNKDTKNKSTTANAYLEASVDDPWKALLDVLAAYDVRLKTIEDTTSRIIAAMTKITNAHGDCIRELQQKIAALEATQYINETIDTKKMN